MSHRTAHTSEQAKDRFIEEVSSGASIKEACAAAGFGRSTAYDLRQRDERFALRWHDALEEGTEALEEEARRRAMEGSDHLMMFLLKARRPEIYRDRVSVDQTTRAVAPTGAEARALQAAAERDPEAFARIARAAVDALQAEEDWR
jgi:hypothetical protein